MSLMNKFLSLLSSLALVTLVACGGGGGGSSPTPPTPPTIATQPASQTVQAGALATFSVTAAGSAPMTYQWNKGGTTISGATAASYTTPAAVAADNGASFTVTVSNSGGSVTSSAAILTVQSFATSLVYTDPTSGTYLLKKNVALSTATHLVLDLVGPSATTGSGVSATFNVDTTKATWANVATIDATGTYVQNGTAFNLGTAPQILKAKVTSGALQVTAAQKGTASPVALNVPLLRLALDLKGTPTAGPVSLSADATKSLVLDGTGTLTAITISTGTVTAQ